MTKNLQQKLQAAAQRVESNSNQEISRHALRWMKSPTEEDLEFEEALRSAGHLRPGEKNVYFEPESVEHRVVHVYTTPDSENGRVLEVKPKTGKVLEV